MNIATAFRPMADFESAAAELYGWFATLFADDSQARALFGRMALEEKAHLNLIDYQRRLLRSNPRLAMGIEIDVDAMALVLDRILEFRHQPNPPSLSDAVTLALEIERGAAEFHLRVSLGQGDTEFGRLLAQLGTADRGHIDRIEDFAGRIRKEQDHMVVE